MTLYPLTWRSLLHYFAFQLTYRRNDDKSLCIWTQQFKRSSEVKIELFLNFVVSLPCGVVVVVVVVSLACPCLFACYLFLCLLLVSLPISCFFARFGFLSLFCVSFPVLVLMNSLYQSKSNPNRHVVLGPVAFGKGWDNLIIPAVTWLSIQMWKVLLLMVIFLDLVSRHHNCGVWSTIETNK